MADAIRCLSCGGALRWDRDLKAEETFKVTIGMGGGMQSDVMTCDTPGCPGNRVAVPVDVSMRQPEPNDRAREAAAKLRDLMGRVALGEVVVEGLEPDPRLSEALAAGQRLLAGDDFAPVPAARPENPTDFVAKYILGRRAERMEALLRRLEHVGYEGPDGYLPAQCPECDAPEGHAPGCELAALLAELDAAKATQVLAAPCPHGGDETLTVGHQCRPEGRCALCCRTCRSKGGG